jgi:hypothetical protein
VFGIFDLSSELLEKGGRPGKLSPLQPWRSRRKDAEDTAGTDTDSRSDGIDDSAGISNFIDESGASGFQAALGTPTPMNHDLPMDLLPRWMEVGYEMSGDELNIISDFLNQLSAELNLRHICLPWFYVAGHFESPQFSLSDFQNSQEVQREYMCKGLDDKKVTRCSILIAS